MLKKIIASALCVSMLFVATACTQSPASSSSSLSSSSTISEASNGSTTDKGLEVLGDTLKYDPNTEINNGEPIEIEFWTWDFVEIFQGLIDDYQAIHPNVKIKLVETPWSDYWTKLPLALGSKDGPAAFAVHNGQHDNIINYMAPYDIPLDELRADFLNVDSHLIDDKIYYMDYAIMTSNIYYNKDMWKAAGLTDADLPKTWEQLAEVAKKLTIKEGDTIKQAGFNLNGTLNQILLGMNYQFGQNLFNEDGTVTVNNQAMKDAFQTFVDMYKVSGVGSENFGNVAGESFGQGQSAMICMWGYYHNNLVTTYPDIDFGVIQTPTFEKAGDVYAYNRYNGESSVGINKNISQEQMAVAQDFVRYSLANDKFLTDYSVKASCFPTKISLSDAPEIQNHPVLSALAPNIDKYVWPGPMPATLEDNLKIAVEEVFYNGVSIDNALAKAEKAINEDLKTIEFTPVENMYKYAK